MMLMVLRLFAPVAYVNRWSNVRGVNYVPSYSANPIQMWMDYNGSTVERELGYAQDLHLNTVRVFLHIFAWAADRDQFLSNYDHLVSACAARGIKPLIVLFDDDFYDIKSSSGPITTLHQAAAWVQTKVYRGAQWMANPGMAMLAADYASSGFNRIAGSYIDDVAGREPGDKRLLGFDIMNEPSRKAPFAGGLATFIEFAFRRTAKVSSGMSTTIDNYHYSAAQPLDLAEMETAMSYHNYYQYSHYQDCANVSDVKAVQGDIAAAQYASAAKLNKPVLASEFGQFGCYCPAATAIQQAGVGWIAWELMLSHDQFEVFQGLVYPNGTARSAKEADCLRDLAKRGMHVSR